MAIKGMEKGESNGDSTTSSDIDQIKSFYFLK